MMSFEYRALDLLADYETRFAYFPAMFFNHIESSANSEVRVGFIRFLDAMSRDCTEHLCAGMTDEQVGIKLGNFTERDEVAMKSLRDLGVNSAVSGIIAAYFVSRRNLLEDERCWIRFTNLIDEEISIKAC